ncbi:unnamed protein product, partial [Closterium sp. NIES-54]
MVHQVLQRFGFLFSSPQPTPLSTSHLLSAPPSDNSVEPTGPYPELVGCLMYLMTCTRPDLAYPLSLLARYVGPGRHRKTLPGLTTQLRSGRHRFTPSALGSGSLSWRSIRSSSVLSSSYEAEIYARAMAAQELRWLTYLLTGLGEQPRSPPILYVDNKALIALCQEHRLEHRTKHIALRYFLAREFKQRGQLRLAYMATRANTVDIFTKALPPEAQADELVNSQRALYEQALKRRDCLASTAKKKCIHALLGVPAPKKGGRPAKSAGKKGKKPGKKGGRPTPRADNLPATETTQESLESESHGAQATGASFLQQLRTNSNSLPNPSPVASTRTAPVAVQQAPVATLQQNLACAASPQQHNFHSVADTTTGELAADVLPDVNGVAFDEDEDEEQLEDRDDALDEDEAEESEGEDDGSREAGGQNHQAAQPQHHQVAQQHHHEDAEQQQQALAEPNPPAVRGTRTEGMGAYRYRENRALQARVEDFQRTIDILQSSLAEAQQKLAVVEAERDTFRNSISDLELQLAVGLPEKSPDNPEINMSFLSRDNLGNVIPKTSLFPKEFASAGKLNHGGSGKCGAAFDGASYNAEVASCRRFGSGGVVFQSAFEAIVAAPSSSDDGPLPSPSGRFVHADAARDRLRSASVSDAWTAAQHDVAQNILSASGGACGRATAGEYYSGIDDSSDESAGKFATSPGEHNTATGKFEGDDTATGFPVTVDSTDKESCSWYIAARAARLHSVAPLLRQSSLTTYLPSTAAAFAGSGGFQAEAASMMMRHGAHAAAATLSRFPAPMMAFFDSLDSRSNSDSSNVECNSKTLAAGALVHCVRPAPVPTLLEVPAQPAHLDTSAVCADTGGSEFALRQSEAYFDGKLDDTASADVPMPRLPRRCPFDGTAERRGAGDASKCGATSTAVPSGGRHVPSPQTDKSQIPDAVGSIPGSENKQRCAAVDGTKEGAGESLGAAIAAAASGARPGFVWQCSSSACLNPSSSNATTDDSRDGSAGGGSSGEENPERSHALAGRAGNSLFEDWTDLRGRRPRVVGGGSGTAPGKEALVKATEGLRPIFHQKTPSGRILQELFELESGPLDLEFLVSLRTLSRSSSTRSSSARSSTYARDTPTATPSRPLSSLATASCAPAVASDGPALSGAASASASPGSEATTEFAGAASSESHAPQSSALVPATPAAPAHDEGIDNHSDAADDCSVDEEEEAAAAAASAWAAVELVDGSSSLHSRRGLFGLRAKSGSSNSSSSSSITTTTTNTTTTNNNNNNNTTVGESGNSMEAIRSRVAVAAAASAAASRAAGSGSLDHFAAAATCEVFAAVHAIASDGEIRHAFPLPPVPLPAADAAAAAAAPPPPLPPGAAVGGSPGFSGESSASAGHHNDISSAPGGQCLAGSRGCAPSSSVRVANSNSGGSAGMGSNSSSSSSRKDVGKVGMVAWKEPEPSIHDAAWRMLVLQQQKIATMEEEIMLLRQRCRVAGPASEKSRSGGGAVTAAGSSGCDALVSEEQGAGGASGAGAPARAESKSLNLTLLETDSDAADAGRWGSSSDNPVSPRFSPRPAVAAMGAAAAAAAAATGKALPSSPSAGAFPPNTADERSCTNSLGMAGDGFSHDDLALAIALSLAESDPGIRLALENPSKPTSSAERGCAGDIAQEPRKDWSISGFASSGSSRGGAEGSTAAELRGRGGEAERRWERNPREARDVITIDDEAEGEAEEAESWSRKVEGVGWADRGRGLVWLDKGSGLTGRGGGRRMADKGVVDRCTIGQQHTMDGRDGLTEGGVGMLHAGQGVVPSQGACSPSPGSNHGPISALGKARPLAMHAPYLPLGRLLRRLKTRPLALHAPYLPACSSLYNPPSHPSSASPISHSPHLSRPFPHPSSAFIPALPPSFLPPFLPSFRCPCPQCHCLQSPPPPPTLTCWTLPLPAVPPPPDPDLLDPCPDITALFRHYNDLYFQGHLGACLVEWSSKRMTLCAGVCMYDGALCRIRLSAPLLQYRPVSDLKATLLHEMIHAFIFLCRPSHSREDHGPMFQGIMGTINTSTLHDQQRPPGGYQISIYHSFKDEVNEHRRHAWQCIRCQEEVRRAMNRPPSVADCMALRQPYTAEGRGGREQGGNGQGGRGQGGRGQGGNGGTMTAEEKERERQRRMATCRHPR